MNAVHYRNALHLFPLLILIFFCCNYCTLSGAKKQEPPKTEHEFPVDDISEKNARKFELGKCAFYCFFVPLEDNVRIDLHFYQNISCSDIVYGFAEVNDIDLKLPTKLDIIRHATYGNIRLITSLHLISTSPRVLLGMKNAALVRFLKSNQTELARNVSRRMVFYARRYGFSGIFLKFNLEALQTEGFDQFVELLGNEVKLDQKRSGSRKLRLILSISSNWARHVYRRISIFDVYFDAFYLWADETDTATELPIPRLAVPVDPLHFSEGINRQDSISNNAEQLAIGVARKKIIIGLSAWARSYLLLEEKNSKITPEVAEFGISGEESGQLDGKLAYQEVCNLVYDNQHLYYNNQSETLVLRKGDYWYSFNEPDHAAFTHKLEWISSHEFGGIGLYSIQGDDPRNNCTKGLLPLHRSIADRFKCRRGSKRGNVNKGDCTRICMLDLEKIMISFDFDRLQPGWCSHLVIFQAQLNTFLHPVPSSGMLKAIKKYNNWECGRKPFLILSFGGNVEQMRMAAVAPSRFVFIEGIRRLLDEHNADGVELNYASGGPDGPGNVFLINGLLADLRRTLGRQKQILVSLNPSSFIDYPNFDFGTMARSVDYIVAIGYRYHRSTNPYTGHHSPLFKNSTMLNLPRMTIQGTVEELLSRQVPPKKLVVAFSAEAMSQHLAEDLLGHRSWEYHKIGDPAAQIYPQISSLGAGILSQTQVCMLIKDENTLSHFLNELGVPYLVNNEKEFVAFDNRRSIQIKTVWLSLQNIGGIALHALELDNVLGECPVGQPFTLLRTIVQSQICARCDFNASQKSNTSNEKLSEIRKDVHPAATPSSSIELLNDLNNDQDMQEDLNTVEKKDKSSEQNSSVIATSRCRQSAELGNLSLLCALPLAGLGRNLTLEKLPFDRCDSLVLNGWATIHAKGLTIAEQQANMINKLVALARGNRTALWAEVTCEMEHEQWKAILKDRRQQLASSLEKFLTDNKLAGVLLDCDSLMMPTLRTEFSQFLNELNVQSLGREGSRLILSKREGKEKGVDVNDEDEECDSRLALKLQLSRENISEVYEPEQLNKLLKFLLLPAGIAVSKSKARVLNPLYALGISNQESTKTQNGTSVLLQSGKVKSSLIVLELPAYAILQRREEGNTIPEIVTQQEVCMFMRKMGVQQHIRYDAVTAYWKTNNEWLSAENSETVRYKVMFAMQRRFGGLLLRSLDADDPEDRCKKGAGFGLLTNIHMARCGRNIE